MGFVAANVVKPLEYDLRTPDNPKGRYGVIREPSDRQIANYMSGIKELIKTLKADLPEAVFKGGDDIDITALFMAVDDLDTEVIVRFHEDMAGIFAALCSGEPSQEDLLAVPIRIRVVFYAWLQREVMSPEVESGAGSNVTKLPARAG